MIRTFYDAITRLPQQNPPVAGFQKLRLAFHLPISNTDRRDLFVEAFVAHSVCFSNVDTLALNLNYTRLGNEFEMLTGYGGNMNHWI